MNKIVHGIAKNEDIVIGGNINEHLGSDRIQYEKVFGERNEMEEKILDFQICMS